MEGKPLSKACYIGTCGGWSGSAEAVKYNVNNLASWRKRFTSNNTIVLSM